MKKYNILIIIILITYMTACSQPEDEKVKVPISTIDAPISKDTDRKSPPQSEGNSNKSVNSTTRVRSKKIVPSSNTIFETHRVEEISATKCPNMDVPEGLTYLTAEEIIAAEITQLGMDKERLIEEGFTLEIYRYENRSEASETYEKENVTFAYLDGPQNLSVYNVTGECPYSGPRGILIGDSFCDIMALLPQEKDWTKEENGLIYGVEEVKKTSNRSRANASDGYIVDGQSYQHMSIITQEGKPFIQMKFIDYKLVEYRVIVNYSRTD